MGSLAFDLRQSFRTLLRRPAFALIAAAILAVGIGSTTAVFSMIEGVLLTPPPYTEPERIVLVSSTRLNERDAPAGRNFVQPQWDEWQAEMESFTDVAGYRWMFNFLVLGDGSESLEGMMVSERYFDVTGLEPQLGRALVEGDDVGTETPGIILGHDLWQRHFDGDPGVIGETVRLSRWPPFTVVGVMPPNVRFLPSPGVAQEPNYDLHARADFWIPIPEQMREQPAWNVVARLAPGATAADAESELAVLMAQQAEVYPVLEDLGARVDPLADVLNEEGRRILLPLLAAAALVLLIACGNAAALLLIRGLQRQHEYGLRSAVGAGRARMFGHVIAESLTFALLGGALGVGLALAIVRVFRLIGGDAIPRLDDVSVGWPVLAFGLGTAAVACLLAGLVPALRASSLKPSDALRLGGHKSSEGRAQRRLLGGVVMGQTALTLALLVGAGLLIKTMYNLDAVQSGYQTENVLTMSVTAVEGDLQSFHVEALDAVSALPGIESAAFAWGVPLTGNNWNFGGIEVEGFAPPDGSEPLISIPTRSVTPGYFDLLGQRLALGRDFRETDTGDAARVVVVNEAFVDRYLGGASPMGRRIWTRGRDNDPSEIVGVVANGRTDDLTRPAEPELYVSFWQNGAFSKHLVVRSAVDPSSIVGAIRRELREIAPTVAVENVKTLDQIRIESVATRTFATQLLIGFAVIASILTLAGIYSVLSLSVTARERELAIRTAIGANRLSLTGLVLGQGLRLIGAGTVVGLAAAIALGSVLEALLFEVRSADPTILAGAAAAFVVVALAACLAPANRAARVDPVEALKGD